MTTKHYFDSWAKWSFHVPVNTVSASDGWMECHIGNESFEVVSNREFSTFDGKKKEISNFGSVK